MARQHDDLLKLMPKIAEVVNKFQSEAVQLEVYRTLIEASSSADGQTAPGKGPKASPTPRRRTRRAQPADASDPDTTDDAANTDANSIINSLKERNDIDLLSTEVFHKKDLWNKIRLVLLLADMPMTSGQVFAVLDGLDVKTSLPSVSKRLKKEHSSLITSGVRKPGAVNTYKLSGPAKSQAKKWLNELGE